jgi:hypothetical protein
MSHPNGTADPFRNRLRRISKPRMKGQAGTAICGMVEEC